MTREVKVRVEWAQSKRDHLPSSTKYCTVAKFPEDLKWPSTAWSISLSFDAIPANGSTQIQARASFLSPDAPVERLASGKIFELYEGLERSATVFVL
jgi:hypothetical protein